MFRNIEKIESKIRFTPKKKRVAAYVRVSSDKDAMLHSLSAQISYFSEYIQRNPKWDYVGVYVDKPLTGTKDDRPEFIRLISDCKNKKIDLILTKSISRFTRNTITMLETVRMLKELQVDVYFQRENIHSLSGDGELILTILSSFAQEESRSVSENCKWRIRDNFKKGLPSNFKIFGYNLKNYNLEVIPKEAEIVKMIFNDYLSGMGKLAIAKKLNDLGFRTKYGKQWYESVIHQMLRNNTYTGEMTLQKSFINNHIDKKKVENNGELSKYHVENSHEAIIDKEIFQKVQYEIENRAGKYKHHNVRQYTFTGLITCGICGGHFKRKILNAGTKYAKPGWVCNTYNSLGKYKCCNKIIPDNILKTLSAGVLKLNNIDNKTIKEKINHIIAMPDNTVIFNLKDDSKIKEKWKHESRKKK